MHLDIIRTKEDEYLESKGIKSSYAFLCSSPQLVSSFVKETAHITKQFNGISQFGKLQMYQQYFPEMEGRPKYTGFENVKEHDAKIRASLYAEGKDEPQNIPFIETESAFEDYIKCALLSLHNPLVYYSGGLDSEFLLKWFLKFGLKPECVVISWTYNGQVVNVHDLEWANKFLQSSGLKARRVGLELSRLWEDVTDISDAIGRSSPQHIAYVKSIELLSRHHKYCHHVMAGEIRYALTKE